MLHGKQRGHVPSCTEHKFTARKNCIDSQLRTAHGLVYMGMCSTAVFFSVRGSLQPIQCSYHSAFG